MGSAASTRKNSGGAVAGTHVVSSATSRQEAPTVPGNLTLIDTAKVNSLQAAM